MSEEIVSFTSGGKEYMFVKPPKVVGWWQITPTVDGGWSTRFAVYAPLKEEHIKNTEELLGWKWIPEEPKND